MKYKAEIKVIRRREILDPQGKAVEKGIKLIGFDNVSDVRIDKSVEFLIDADSENEAVKIIEKICNELLANPHMEDYSYKILPL